MSALIAQTENAAARILVVDDKEPMREVLRKFLAAENFLVETAADARQALALIENSHFDLILSDIKMPGMDGNELLDRVRAKDADTIVILMTAFGSIEAAVSAIKRGAVDYVSKPFEMDDVILRIRRALEERGLRRRVADLERQVASQRATNAIIGSSAPIKRLRQIIERVAPLNDTILITGETGTGKELIARALHEEREQAKTRAAKHAEASAQPNATRRGKPISDAVTSPFVALDCSAIPETLIEAELFGYEKGAFTGATEARAGLFELASDGTLFLDEVETLTPAVQAKLLRVLQERTTRRVGGRRDIVVRARIVAATNIDLCAAVERGEFRRDLFYRLAVIPVHAPPLRERREDIPELIAHLLARRAAERHAPTARLTPEALKLLIAYDYPGNVRELENIISYTTALVNEQTAGGAIIRIEDLPPHVIKSSVSLNAQNGETQKFIPATLAEIERRHVLQTLEAAGGNQAQAARMLGIDRRTLYNKLQQWKVL